MDGADACAACRRPRHYKPGRDPVTGRRPRQDWDVIWGLHLGRKDWDRLSAKIESECADAATPWALIPGLRVPPEVREAAREFRHRPGWYNDEGLIDYLLERFGR